VYIGGGDPKDTNHTPLRTMFTLKNFSKNNSSDTSIKKVSAFTNKPDLTADLDIDASMNASNKNFKLSHGIIRKLEKGQIDHLFDQNEVIKQGQESMGKGIDNPLNNRLIIGYFGVNGMESHASYLDPEKYVNSRGQEQLDALASASGSANRSAYGTAKRAYDIYDDYTTVKDRAEAAKTIYDGSKEDRICLVLEYTTAGVGGAIGGATGGPTGFWVGEKAGAFVGSELCKVSKGEQTMTQKAWEWVKSLVTMPNPEDPNGGAPAINNRAAGLINSYLEKHGNITMDSLRNLDLDIDPQEDGGKQDNSGYFNPALVAIEFTNSGTSTGTWEVSGGAYLGPNMNAVNDSLGGTSTGDAPLI